MEIKKGKGILPVLGSYIQMAGGMFDCFTKSLIIIALSVAIPLFGQIENRTMRGVSIRPVILDAQPKSFVQHTDGLRDKSNVLTIAGRRLWPKDPTVFQYTEQRVQILLRLEGGFVEVRNPIQGRAGDLQTMSISFSGKEWLQKPGILQVAVKANDMISNAYSITILPAPSAPAAVYSVEPSRFVASFELPPGTSPRDYYRFTVRGAHFDSIHKMRLTVDGRKVPIENLEVEAGRLDGVIPSALWNHPGRYAVKVSTRKGPSRVQYLTIEASEQDQDQSDGVIPVEVETPAIPQQY